MAIAKATKQAEKILVVDDEWDSRDLLQTLLESEGYDVRVAADGQDALKSFFAWQPSVVILDLRIPQVDGLQVLERIRQTSETPVIIYSASGQEEEKVRGLRRGADDYLVKPASLRELCARLEAILRRTRGPIAAGSQTYQDGAIRVDFSRHAVYLRGSPVALSAQEFRLLATLIAEPGVVFSTDRLLDLCWGEGEGGPENVRVYVGYLRKKIEDDHRLPKLIETVREFGYRYRPPSQS